MSMRNTALSLSAAVALALTGCATTYGGDPYYSSNSARQYDRGNVGAQMVSYGVVDSVRPVSIQREQGLGAGAVTGAIVGGLVGNQIGGGRGRDLATVGGAVAGGAVGHQVQRSRNHENGIEIVVRLENGSRVAVIQNQDYNLRPGDRVRVVGQGNDARVSPR